MEWSSHAPKVRPGQESRCVILQLCSSPHYWALSQKEHSIIFLISGLKKKETVRLRDLSVWKGVKTLGERLGRRERKGVVGLEGVKTEGCPALTASASLTST